MNESDFDGTTFTHMGYAIVCCNCQKRIPLPSATTVAEARADATSKGVVFDGGRSFCHDNCRREHAGEICLHVLARSGPDSFACVKCGLPRAECFAERGNPCNLAAARVMSTLFDVDVTQFEEWKAAFADNPNRPDSSCQCATAVASKVAELSPREIAEAAYRVDSVAGMLRRQRSVNMGWLAGDKSRRVPEDVESMAFAVWLTDQCREAMQRGIEFQRKHDGSDRLLQTAINQELSRRQQAEREKTKRVLSAEFASLRQQVVGMSPTSTNLREAIAAMCEKLERLAEMIEDGEVKGSNHQ